MSVGMMLKIFSDCCVCFAILGAFPTVIPYRTPLLWPALLCGAAAGLAAFFREKDRAALSRLCAAVPLLSLLWVETAGETVILLPVLAYTAVVILRGRMQLEYYSYRQFFLRSLLLLGGLYLALCAFSTLEGFSGEGESVIRAGVTLRYALVHLLCGVILQRRLRLGLERRGRGDAGQIAVMLGGIGVAVGGFLVAEPVLRRGAAAVFKALLSAVVGTAMAGLEVFTTLLDEVELNAMAKQVEQARDDSPTVSMGALGEQIQQALPEGESEPSLWWLVLVAAVLIAAMTLMFLTFRRKSAQVCSEETAETVELPERDGVSRRSNRGRVRLAYREFLRMERKRGLRLRRQDTSEDILLRISAQTDAQAAAELRSLYLRARYDRRHEISREQAQAARDALKRCRAARSEA